MAFPNLYYKRTATTAKACYICYKPTATVLATIDTSDFFYTCPVHLTDHGFATRAPDPEAKDKAAVSPEEIARVKQEWEEKQRLMKEKEKEKKADDDGKKENGDKERKDAGEKDADAQGSKVDAKKLADPTPLSNGSRSSSSFSEPSSRPTHERYVLHRDIFALRTADHRRRRQATQAKALASRLPGAPRSS